MTLDFKKRMKPETENLSNKVGRGLRTRRTLSLKPQTQVSALAFIALAMTGCATFDGIGFGLDVANADTTISLRHADGKSVLAAEQAGNRINFNVRR
jgi:hypothetical protein